MGRPSQELVVAISVAAADAEAAAVAGDAAEAAAAMALLFLVGLVVGFVIGGLVGSCIGRSSVVAAVKSAKANASEDAVEEFKSASKLVRVWMSSTKKMHRRKTCVGDARNSREVYIDSELFAGELDWCKKMCRSQMSFFGRSA